MEMADSLGSRLVVTVAPDKVRRLKRVEYDRLCSTGAFANVRVSVDDILPPKS